MAEGPVGVRVSGEAVRLSATGRAAELLVLLLELGGRATLDQLISKLFEAQDDFTESRRSELPEQHLVKQRKSWRTRIGQCVNQLQTALGWAGSVSFSAQSGVYELGRGQGVSWSYDIAELRLQGRAPRDFASGIDSNWVADKRDEWGI